MSYEPRGKVKALLDAMNADPQRIWSSADAAKALGVPEFRSTLLAYTDSACRNGLMFRRMTVGGELQFRLVAFDVAPESTGWKLPQMACTRPGAGTAAPTARGHDNVDGLAPGAPRIYPDEPHEDAFAKMEAAGQERREPAGEAETGRPADLGGAEASVHLAVVEPQKPVGYEQEPTAEPVTWNLWEDGDLDLFGLVELENGAYRLPAEALRRLRKFIAWMPA